MKIMMLQIDEAAVQHRGLTSMTAANRKTVIKFDRLSGPDERILCFTGRCVQEIKHSQLLLYLILT